MRASDRTRHRTTLALARAAGEGFLSVDTLSLRLDAAFSAREVDRLDALVADLPWCRRPPATVVRTLLRRLTNPPGRALLLAIPSPGQKVVIGRSSDCDIALRDRAISRHHVRLRRTPDGWDVLDLGSTNGTWLNGRRVIRAVGLPGDELELAGHRLLLPYD